MKVEELKYFLRFLGLKLNGTKEELAARVFVAFENKGVNCKTKTMPGILWPEKVPSNCE